MTRTLLLAVLTLLVSLPLSASAAPGFPPLPGGGKAPDMPDVNCFDVPSPMCFDFEAHALPTSVEEFLALRKELMSDKDEWNRAYGGAALFMYALLVRTYDAELGAKFLVISLDAYNLSDGDVYKGKKWTKSASFHLDEQLGPKPHIPRSHVKGSSNGNGYKADLKKPVTLVFRRQLKHVPLPNTGKAKVFACTSGAPTCRPINLHRNTKGIWKVYEFSSISVDIKKPPVTDDGDDI